MADRSCPLLAVRCFAMKQTSARLLRLLALLQTRPVWSGADLADRLGVTSRTLRRDIDKLRDLDYPVHAGRGPGGGYRLGAGTTLPPLQLDEDEATAVAIGLRTAAGGSVSGVAEASLRALVKLEQLLPSRLRHRIAAVQVDAVQVPGTAAVDIDVVTAVATSSRDRHRLRFEYRKHTGEVSLRDVEPHHLVTWGRRWYLVAWDVGRDDWRTFRVDRMEPKQLPGPRFAPRAVPGGDATAFVTRGVAQLWPYEATVRLHVPADAPEAQEWITYARLTPVDASTCLLHVGADGPRDVACLLGWLTVDFDVVDAPDLTAQLRRSADRFSRAAG